MLVPARNPSWASHVLKLSAHLKPAKTHLRVGRVKNGITLLLIVLTLSFGWPSVGFAATYSLTELYEFGSLFELTTLGRNPDSGLIADSSGNLYGTNYDGGTGIGGTIYNYNPGKQTVSVVASFSFSSSNPVSTPIGNLIIDNNGNFFGTAKAGGVYEVAAGSNTVTSLGFPPGGQVLQGSLSIDSNGNIYGISGNSVFEVSSQTHVFTTIASTPAPIGNLLVDSAGNVYGVTNGGGSNGSGTVFEITANTQVLTTLASLDPVAQGSTISNGGLVEDSKGNLYGETYSGGANGLGSIFEVAANTHSVTTLASFNGANGENPQYTLTVDAFGNLSGRQTPAERMD